MSIVQDILDVFQRQSSKPAARIRAGKTPARATTPIIKGMGVPVQKRKREYYEDNLTPKVQCLAVDWLELAYLHQPDFQFIEPYYEFEKWKLVETIRNKTWRRVYNVFYDGKKFGLLKTNAVSNQAIKSNEVHLKLENSWLYSEYKMVLYEFDMDLRLDYSHLSRLDVAGDGKNILHPLNLSIMGKITRVAKGRSQHAFMEAKVDEYCEIHSRYYRLGSTLSEKFMRVYDKAAELKNSGKNYIKNFWLLNGIEDVECMERIELTIRAKFCRHVFEVEQKCSTIVEVLDLLENQKFLASVLDNYTKGMYEFRLKNTKRINECREAYALSFTLSGSDNPVLCKLGQPSRSITDGLYIVKMAIKAAWQLFLKTGQVKYKYVSHELAYNSYLHTYFSDRKPAWSRDYERLANRCAVKPVVSQPFLDFFKAGRAPFDMRLRVLPTINLENEGKALDVIHNRKRFLKQEFEAHQEHLQLMELNLQHA